MWCSQQPLLCQASAGPHTHTGTITNTKEPLSDLGSPSRTLTVASGAGVCSVRVEGGSSGVGDKAPGADEAAIMKTDVQE